MAQPVQEWHAKGTDCCSPFELCLKAWCCSCFVHGKIAHRINKDPNLQGYSSFNFDCCAWYCLATVGCQWIFQMMQRAEIRRKYNLKGDGCTDCLCACCCIPCDLTQQEKETEFREKERLMAAGGAAPVQVQPAKLQNEMAYQQQQQQQPQQQMIANQPVHAQQQPVYHQQSPPPQQQYQATPPPHQYQATPPPQQYHQ